MGGLSPGRPETIDIASVVSAHDVLDFAVLRESLLECWTSPFRLHAFAVDDESQARLARLPDVEVHPFAGQPSGLIEDSGLERCIVAQPANVFVQETPELLLLLERCDLVFVSGPWPQRPIAASVWAFRAGDRTRAFARDWDGEPPPVALLEQDAELRVEVLTQPAAPDRAFRPAPYAFDIDHAELAPRADWLGFKHPQVGRAKIVWLGGLEGAGSESVAARIEAMIDRFPQSSPFLPFYAVLANRAAAHLGMETARDPAGHVRGALEDAGVLSQRRQLATLLNQRGLLGRAVEVGVQDGWFSEKILSRWRGEHLLSVDPWLAAPSDEYVDIANRSQDEHDAAYETAQRRLAPFGERSTVWRMTSVEAAARIPPASLDFAYLDARHDYVSVKEDLEAWIDKVRPGGIIAGHDYLDGVLPQGVFGVKSAVDEFFAARGLRVRETYVDAPWSSWYVELPRA